MESLVGIRVQTTFSLKCIPWQSFARLYYFNALSGLVVAGNMTGDFLPLLGKYLNLNWNGGNAIKLS